MSALCYDLEKRGGGMMKESKAVKTVEVDQTELKRLILTGENRYFEQTPSRDSELTFHILLNALREKSENAGSTEIILRTLGLMDGNGVCNNAAALLADHNEFPGIDIVRFGKDINEILMRKTIEKVSILTQLKEAIAVFEDYYKIEEIRGMERKARYLIPQEAFRETVANALVHRTWDVRAHIRIAMYEDRVEVYSPGGLPEGVSEGEYINGFLSVPRNPIIAYVFFRLGIIERFGTGIFRIKNAYREIRYKPVFEVSENGIHTVLPSSEKRVPLTEDEQSILHLLEPDILLSSADLMRKTGFGKDKVVRLLNQLISKQVVEKEGRGRGTRYRSLLG